MREVLFRGKRADNGEWEYGDLWCNPYGKRVVCIVSPINNQGTTGGNEVDPSTVGQYTGLTDKNGRKIFEGDIIDYNGELAKVVYYNDDAAFDVFFDTWNTDFSVLYASHVEVIGNIYDNPEPREGGADNG